jgi:SAM-dependent methyltransferase
VYIELFRRVPFHPQLKRITDPSLVRGIVAEKCALLSRYLKPSTTFLELGAGDCALSIEVANRVRQVYALDVSDEITGHSAAPGNFKLVISDGTSIPVPDGSISVAYSYQLMEHIHPDDAVEQLTNIYRALAPGGVYICITPNRLTGPHDISHFFTEVASGFHLKEYTQGEVAQLFTSVGFSDVRLCTGVKGRFAEYPSAPSMVFETLFGVLPWRIRQRLGALPLVRHLLIAAIVGYKRQ